MTQPSSTEHPRLIVRENVSILSTYRTPGAKPIIILSYNNEHKTLEADTPEFNLFFPMVNKSRTIMGAAKIGGGYGE